MQARRQTYGSHAKRIKVELLENLAGMCGAFSNDIMTTSMIIDNFHVSGALISPDETDAPLVIDPHGMLA